MSHHLDGLPVEKGRFCAESRSGTGVASGFAARLRRLLRSNRGAVAVEFGLSAPLLLGVLVPVADLGIAFSMQQQLEQAVQAGAQYAATYGWNQNAIASAAAAATTLSGIGVSPYEEYGCPSTGSANGTTGSSSGITTATRGSTCTNGETAGHYVVVSAQLSYTPILPYSLLGSSRTLTAQSMIRIR